ncbi:MAG TPA: hypothetical protein VK066_22510 [Chloroflexota bacterium]|nr:hypothetical protein [Chloroflexota bacterium]
MLLFWLAWERFASWQARLQPVRPGALVRYRPTTHHGPPVALADGTVVQAGDRIVELHLDNEALLRLATSPDWTPWQALRRIADDLVALVPLEPSAAGNDFVALHGVTLFAGLGGRLRFDTRPLPRTWHARFVRLFLVGLLAIYHPRGWGGAARLAGDGWPGEIWLSAAALRRLAADRAHRARTPSARAPD